MSQITVNKDSFKFLNIFNQCVSNDSSKANKINLFIEDDKLYLMQYSDSLNLVHIIQSYTFKGIHFNVWYETSFIFNFIKSVPDKTDIIFSEEEGIKIGNKSWYKPKTFQYENDQFNLIQSLIEDDNIKKYKIKDIDLINKARYFIGNPYTKEFDCIRVDKDNFTTSYSDDKVSVVIKSEKNKDIDDSFYIDKSIYNVVKTIGYNEIELSYLNERNYFMFNIDNEFYLFYPEKKYELPNLNDQEIIPLYYHSDKIELNRKDFLDILNRLSLITSKDYQNRIYFNILSEDTLEIECKDGAEAKETISAIIDKNIIGKYFILSSVFVQQILSLLTEDVIVFRFPDCEDEKDEIATSIMNKENEDVIYIHSFYEKIPSV